MRIQRALASIEVIAGGASGLLLTMAVPPSPLWPLGYVALVPLLLVLFDPDRIRDGRRVAWGPLSLSFGLVHLISLLHWISFLTDASQLTFRWILPLGVVLLALFYSVPYVIAIFVAARLRALVGQQAIWWFPGLWVLVEWFRATGDMGFPWMRLATTQLTFLPGLQLAGLLGELGVTLWVAWINVLITMIVFALRGHSVSLGRAVLYRWWPVVALGVVFGGSCLYGLKALRDIESEEGKGPGLKVGLVQANVDLHDKWDPALRDSTFVPYTMLTQEVARQGARLAIWAETAIPMDFMRAPVHRDRILDLARSSSIQLFTGFPERAIGDDGRLIGYNSSILLDEAGVPKGRYRKMHMLPFGERIPWQGTFPFLGKIDFGQAEWAIGPEQTVLEVDGHRFVNLICFESIFSRLARSGVQRGAGFLVNISNDGWYGETLGPHQHGWMAAMRAAENRVPLVRVSNNGISFIALPSGRVVDLLGLSQRGTVVRTIFPDSAGSFYTRWGDQPLLLLMLAGGLFLALVARRRP